MERTTTSSQAENKDDDKNAAPMETAKKDTPPKPEKKVTSRWITHLHVLYPAKKKGSHDPSRVTGGQTMNKELLKELRRTYRNNGSCKQRDIFGRRPATQREIFKVINPSFLEGVNQYPPNDDNISEKEDTQIIDLRIERR